jgi:hypothetical protein
MSAPGTGRLSNGTEGQAWMDAWCHTCVKDINESCPLVLHAMMGDWPDEWRSGPHWSPQTVVSCDAYERKP